ncbi:MAG TPA: MFS transporter [Desulfomonilia bacterium]
MKDEQGYLVSKRYAWYVFFLLFLLYMFNYMDRQVIVSLFPFLKAEWSLSDTQCGFFVAAVYWAIIIFTFPIALLVDRWSRKKSIGIMALLWSAATAACAFTGSFYQLFATRTAVGIGEAGYAPGGTAMISAAFPENKRAFAMGLWNASIPLGSVLGIIGGGMIADHFGWRHAFGWLAIPGAIVALLFFQIRDYKTVDLTKTTEPGKKVSMGFKEISRDFIYKPSLIFAYLGFAGSVFVTTSLISWLPTYYHRLEGLPMAQAGTKGSLVLLLAVIGTPLGGFLADRWLRRRENARPLFCAASSAVTAVTLFIAFSVVGDNLEYPILLFAGMAGSAFVPAAVAITQDVVHPGVRAISYSLCVIVQHLLGSALGPIFIGFMSDKFGLVTALKFLPIFSLFAGVMFLMGSFWYVRDYAKTEKIAVEVQE